MRSSALGVLLCGLLALGFCAAWGAYGLLVAGASPVRSLLEAGEQGRQLDAISASICRRRELKEQLVRRMLAGELTLLETTAHFARINREMPYLADRGNSIFPGSTPEEKLCWQVISWADGILTDHPAHDAIVGGFEAELAEHLLADGCVQLPDLDQAVALAERR
jgi:hypothetical protein